GGRWPSCPWLVSTAVVTAPRTRRWPRAGWTSNGCGPRLPGAAAPGGRRAAGAGGGRDVLAATGCAHLSGADPVPHIRTRQGPAHHDPGLAVLVRGGVADRPQFVDRAVGRGTPGPRRRRGDGYGRPATRGGGPADRRRA